MRLRRVLLTADAVGGVWQYTTQLADGFAARGVTPIIALMGPVDALSPILGGEGWGEGAFNAGAVRGFGGLPPSPRPSPEDGRGSQPRVIEIGLPLDWTAGSAAEVRDAAARLARIARDERADTVHLHAPALADAAWPCPTVAVAHSCTTTWWRAVRGGPLPKAFRWRHEMMGRGLRLASVVAAPTAAFAAMVADAYGVAAPVVVRNGRQGVAGLAPREAFVLTAGRLWDEGKNLGVLEDAACAMDVRAAGPAAGPGGAEWRPRNVRALGVLDPAALRDAMARCSVFAAPSVYEPFGLAVLEAAIAGAPLVLADIPSFRELWDGAAVFVDSRDPAAWTVALRAMLTAPGDWGARAAARARDYPAETSVAATVALHDRLAARRAA